MSYGKIENGRIVHAPRVVRMKDGSVVVNPKAAHYAAAVDGPWLPVVDERPTTDEAHVAVPTGWEERDGAVRRVYEVRERPAPTVEAYDAAMEAHLRAERSARGYTTREPDAYLESSNVRWAQDARDWVAHRDAVMSYALAVMNAVKAGLREPPTMEEFRAGFPKVVWTAGGDR